VHARYLSGEPDRCLGPTPKVVKSKTFGGSPPDLHPLSLSRMRTALLLFVQRVLHARTE
jgi:hypothetical protein